MRDVGNQYERRYAAQPRKGATMTTLLHSNFRIKDIGTDRHCSLPVRFDTGPDRALAAVEDWVSLRLHEHATGMQTGKVGYRFFYRDRVCREIMFRLILSRMPDGSINRQLVIAVIQISPPHRHKGNFRTLLSGLEELATSVGATLEVESANAGLSKTLFKLGYLRSGGDNPISAKLWSGLAGHWRYHPEKTAANFLIELPSDVVTAARRPGRISPEKFERVSEVVEAEITNFLSRLAERMREELAAPNDARS